MNPIHYTRPSITALEVEYATDAAANGWGPKCYEYIRRFETAFAEHLGVRHAIATSSCTGALHMGMAALDIGVGDEVILADTNWIATASPIVHLGATPVFVDISPDSWCLSPDLVEAAITLRTRAIIAVHLYGNLCGMDRLLEIGKKHGIPVIEDAAEALGSVYHGQRAGSMGAFGAFSFHGTKTITTGEGGMFVTNDPELYEKVLTLSNHGRSRTQTREFWPDMIGFKYKMSNIQAAIGCAQMERIYPIVERKREILSRYRSALERPGVCRMNLEPEGTIHGAWMPTARFDPATGITFPMLKDAFKARSIDARTVFHPLSSTGLFGEPCGHPVATGFPDHSINLPSYPDMTDYEVDWVVDVIDKLLKP
jgi:perosamine synthetase